MKIIGVIMVILGCGGFGFAIAAAHRREESLLRQLVGVLDFMECELQYRLTALPELCRQAASVTKGTLSGFFLDLTRELEDQVRPDAHHCVQAALQKQRELPKQMHEILVLLGRSLGRWDLEGQIKNLEACRQECRRRLEALSSNRDVRLRSYQTLGLCAGAALAILFL